MKSINYEYNNSMNTLSDEGVKLVSHDESANLPMLFHFLH